MVYSVQRSDEALDDLLLRYVASRCRSDCLAEILSKLRLVDRVEARDSLCSEVGKRQFGAAGELDWMAGRKRFDRVLQLMDGCCAAGRDLFTSLKAHFAGIEIPDQAWSSSRRI
jgi:hypothetical protein